MPKALITGITGQDGSYLAEFLLEKYPQRLKDRFNISDLPQTEIELLEIIGAQRGCHGVILAQHRDIIRPLAREDSCLRSGIAGHVPMAVQVIRAQVQHHSYVEAQSCDSLQHVRRHFEGIDPFRPQDIEIERRRAQIPPDLTGHPGAPQNMVDQRRGGGFAIGAGHAHEARLGMARQHRAVEKFGIAQNGHASRLGRDRRRMGRGQFMRNAGGKQQRVSAEGAGGRVLHRQPGSLSGRTAVEDQKLRRRPQTWRLACQALVNQSVVVLTKPQTGLGDLDQKVSQAKAQPLPVGPTAWPVQESEGDDDAADLANDDQRSGQTTTSDEEP